jgi:hypothetical protein
MLHSLNNIQLYTIFVHHKSDTILSCGVLPPNGTFRRDLLGPRLASCHDLMQRMDLVQLTHGVDVFNEFQMRVVNYPQTQSIKH